MFYLLSLQLMLCFVAAVKSSPVVVKVQSIFYFWTTFGLILVFFLLAALLKLKITVSFLCLSLPENLVFEIV